MHGQRASSGTPLLILISGQPGSGKSTLAKRLAAELDVPCLCRDELTAPLADLLTSPQKVVAQDDRRPIVNASFAAFYAIVGALLDAGLSVIAETNYGRGLAEDPVRALARRAEAIQVHCDVPLEVSQQRFIARFKGGTRHWFFRDDVQIEHIRRGEVTEPWRTAVPLELGLPLLRVDTSAGYRPGLQAIVDFIAARGSGKQ